MKGIGILRGTRFESQTNLPLQLIAAAIGRCFTLLRGEIPRLSHQTTRLQTTEASADLNPATIFNWLVYEPAVLE